ncbi:cadherin-related family member 1-like [Centruroides sculpturatus]|uniref:cadherin-related family member 1-like n=1 Tax=Centruroides sculpturatus TaxID=218467 RepID=UPI000C6E5B84|nr:cadherin-related family member 1-like [Centruroides sculpturatus]
MPAESGRSFPAAFLLLMLMWLRLPSRLRAEPDDLCYLTDGGSSETIIVNENLSEGSVVGRLSISGQPGENGTIRLSLVPPDGPVVIRPDSKELVLARKLDREGMEGPPSVEFDVICSQKGSDELSITIPVRIIVTDANDNRPEFVGAPYTVNVSEVSVVGTVIYRGIRAVDRDQTGPYSTVEYYVEGGEHSHLVAFNTPLDGILILNASLDYESLPTFSVSIRAQDQGEPAQSAFTSVTVNVLDADDQNPKFVSDRYTASLPENPKPGKVLKTSPSPLKAEDPDRGIRSPIVYSFNSNATEYGYFRLQEDTGQLSIRSPIPDDLYLPITLVIRATQADNPDRYALTTLSISSSRISAHQELTFLQTDYSTSVLESAPPGQVILTVQTTKPPDKHVTFRLLDNPSEDFAIHPTGEIIVIKPLDYESRQHYKLRVLVTDGTKSDIARVNISVVDVNDHDPQFGQNQYSFIVKGSDVRSGTLVGKIEVSDQDVNDSIDLSLKGPFARIFAINEEGELRVRNLDILNATTCHVIVVATDDGVPPRQSSVPATISFPDNLVQEIIHKQKKDDSSFILMIVFGVVLGSLLIVIVTLTSYILKHKKYRNRLPTMNSSPRPPVTKMASFMSGTPLVAKSQEGVTNRSGGMENPIFNMADGSRVTPGVNIEAVRSEVEMTDEVPQHPSIQPRMSKYQDLIKSAGSIPRRIKKLSWEDEQPNRTELDPDVSVTPLGKSSHPCSHPDLMIYF